MAILPYILPVIYICPPFFPNLSFIFFKYRSIEDRVCPINPNIKDNAIDCINDNDGKANKINIKNIRLTDKASFKSLLII